MWARLGRGGGWWRFMLEKCYWWVRLDSGVHVSSDTSWLHPILQRWVVPPAVQPFDRGFRNSFAAVPYFSGQSSLSRRFQDWSLVVHILISKKNSQFWIDFCRHSSGVLNRKTNVFWAKHPVHASDHLLHALALRWLRHTDYTVISNMPLIWALR